MKFVDCTWEIENIGKRTCEICYEDKEVFNEELLKEKSNAFDYVVVKVPMNNSNINIGLSKMGFAMIETQLNISKKYKDFNFDDRLVKLLYNHVSDCIVTAEDDLNRILMKMTPDMFSTDRIYLDPHFSHDCSCRRYANWMKSEFRENRAIIKIIMYDGIEIGFGMSRGKGGISYGLLGGIYEGVQAEGYGFLTACAGFITAHKSNNPFIKTYTSISSNNLPMLQIYNYLNFKIDSMMYVFVKHNL